MSSRTEPYEQETRLVGDALNALESKTGIAGRLLELHSTVAPAYEADAIIALTIAGKSATLHCGVQKQHGLKKNRSFPWSPTDFMTGKNQLS